MGVRAAAISAIGVIASAGSALADDGVTIGGHAPVNGNAPRLHARSDLPQPVAIGPSVFPGFTGFVTGLFGISNTAADHPADDFFLLAPQADISGEMTALDGSLVVHNGLHTMSVGDSMHFGQPFFDYHPLMHLPTGGSGSARFVFRDSSGTYTQSVELHLRFVAVRPNCRSDMGAQGGVAGADNALDNNDFVAFIDAFFAADPRADLGRQGGLAGSDGVLDNNDFVAFIDGFFGAC